LLSSLLLYYDGYCVVVVVVVVVTFVCVDMCCVIRVGVWFVFSLLLCCYCVVLFVGLSLLLLLLIVMLFCPVLSSFSILGCSYCMNGVAAGVGVITVGAVVLLFMLSLL